MCVCVCVCVASLTQVVRQLPAAELLRFLPQLHAVRADLVARHVGGHDEDGVLTFDGLPLAVRQTALKAGRRRRG